MLERLHCPGSLVRASGGHISFRFEHHRRNQNADDLSFESPLPIVRGTESGPDRVESRKMRLTRVEGRVRLIISKDASAASEMDVSGESLSGWFALRLHSPKAFGLTSRPVGCADCIKEPAKTHRAASSPLIR